MNESECIYKETKYNLLIISVIFTSSRSEYPFKRRRMPKQTPFSQPINQ